MTQCQCIIASGPNKGKQCKNMASTKSGHNHLFCGIHQKCKTPMTTVPIPLPIPQPKMEILLPLPIPQPKMEIKLVPQPKMEIKLIPQPKMEIKLIPRPTVETPPPLPIPLPKMEIKLIPRPKVEIKLIPRPTVETPTPLPIPLPKMEIKLIPRPKVEIKLIPRPKVETPSPLPIPLPIPRPKIEIKSASPLATDQSYFHGYIMKYDDISLLKFIKNHSDKVTLYTVIKWLHKLITDVQSLQLNKIIHYDIKINNIAIDANNDVHLTNFGLSWQMTNDEIANQNNLKNNFYMIWPLFHNIISTQHGQIVAEYAHLDNTIPKEIPTLEAKFKHNITNYAKEIVLPNIFKVDVYSLAYTFKYNIYTIHKEKWKIVNNDLTVRLRNLLENMTNLDPSNQFNIQQAYEASQILMALIPPSV